MEAHYREYVIVAVVLHAGLDNQGHCRAGLMSPSGWYLAEDHRRASNREPHFAKSVAEIVFLWLVRHDLYAFTGISDPKCGRDDLVHVICTHLHQGRAMNY